MVKHVLLAAGLIAGLAGCEKKKEAPTPQEQATAAAARTEAEALEAAKQREAHARDVAKEKVDVAKDNAEAAKDKAEDIADKTGANIDWKGPDDSWGNDWVAFARGKDRTVDKGDYTIERDSDGTISAWRKTKQVAGNAFAEVKDAALVTQIKTKMALDSDVKASTINVDAEDHTVHLRGNVASPEIAGKAVRLALSTPGAEKVVSHLTWK